MEAEPGLVGVGVVDFAGAAIDQGEAGATLRFATVDLDPAAHVNLIQALLGLTVTEMENVLAKAAVRDRGFGANTAPRARRKA